MPIYSDVLVARFSLETILEKKPDYYNALILLGIILNEQGDSEKALSFMQKAYALSKTSKILNNIEAIKRNPGKKLPYKIVNR